ncbi:MAG TPA: hypothetical protein VMT70_21835 [Vicinamibacteria bacterium]|nr:hypothetical protein [Vicinamibacteria bacterium]
MTTYSRSATCTTGHRIEVSFEWDPQATGAPQEYSKPCPSPACDGRVEFRLPIGADPESLALR